MVSGGWPQYSYSKSQCWHRPMLWWPHTSKPFQEFSPGSFLKTSRCTFTTSWVKLCSSFWPVFVEILSLSCPNPMESNTWGPSWMKPRTKEPKNTEWQNALQHQNKKNSFKLLHSHSYISEPLKLLVPHGLNLLRKELTKSGSLRVSTVVASKDTLTPVSRPGSPTLDLCQPKHGATALARDLYPLVMSK